ncbi:endopeptidase La [Lachnoclostridium sp. Marseille-P6806]|uniref:endopeptidase La n=1 Tax=Lachnoclostridium sp. Marseille-P6806 TaxID=2364793 RepID=UPI002ED2F418
MIMLVIPVYNKIVMPDTNIYFQTQEFYKLAGRGGALDEKVVLLVAKENGTREAMNEESFHPIGVQGVISEVSQEGYIGIKTLGRVNIDMIWMNSDRSFDLTISRRADQHDMDEAESYERLQALKKAMETYADGFDWAEQAKAWIGQIENMNGVVVSLSPWLSIDHEERYALLAEDSIAKRTAMIERVSYEFLEISRVTNEAHSERQQEYQNMYRESAIRKQMELLQKELDALHPENVSDVQRFEKKIAESGMNETARKEAEKILNRLKQEGRENSETAMLYDYLDFVTSLSWKKEEARFIDLGEAERILDEDHYGLKKVKRRILQQIAVMNLRKQQAGSILLFVGAPGTGKTSIGRSIARALGREYVRIALGGVRDEADIRGHRRTYIGAMPGRIMNGIQRSGVSNPVVVLDEVDKLAVSYNGDPASALLEVLDPEQNNSFTDHYMNVPYDLSNVMFICTANTTDTIPAPLLNRMEVISFTGYTPEEKLRITKEHLLPRAMEAMGIAEDQLSISEETLRSIIEDYTMEGGVRGLRKRIDTLCRTAAVRISRTPEEHVSVKPEELRELLDMPPVRHDRILDEGRPGVVTGLAWTQAGGEILHIETLFTGGNGKLTITGQLGDVMKESAQIAVSLVKDMFPDKAELFEKNDLHIHVPAGAVPKDGPSAGITLTTALASLVTGSVVPQDVAMTGEVSLRGAVTAIGGLPEKLLAAQRAGVHRVFIPEENAEDLTEVSPEVRESLTLVPVRTAGEVLAAIGVG